jgi:hypothetical protein
MINTLLRNHEEITKIRERKEKKRRKGGLNEINLISAFPPWK